VYKTVQIVYCFANFTQLAKHPIGKLLTDEESFKALLVKVSRIITQQYTI